MRALANPMKAQLLGRFFRTGPGQYADGDKFLGVMAPQTRQIAKKFSTLSLKEVQKLLHSPWHEERLLALLLLVFHYQKADLSQKNTIFKFYLANTSQINNWDLVDLSAPQIVGTQLLGKNPALLLKLAHSTSLWERRIAIVATFTFIRAKKPQLTLQLAHQFLSEKEDLLHKATGWMLREVGKNCSLDILREFLQKYASQMPRTMLRYAIERFPETERQKYLRTKPHH